MAAAAVSVLEQAAAPGWEGTLAAAVSAPAGATAREREAISAAAASVPAGAICRGSAGTFPVKAACVPARAIGQAQVVAERSGLA